MAQQSKKFIEGVGQALGFATLDSGGKVPASQLPNSIMDYKGTWSAATNTPTLANGTGNAGDVYVNTAAGTVNFGAGNITFAAGDWVIYSGSIWEKSINSNAVVSVNGFTGAVSLSTSDISEGTNLYFQDARAVAAITGAASTITTSNLTTSRVLESNPSGKVSASATTSTELGYLSGVTSAIQTQLDAKIAKNTLSAKGSLISATAASTPAEVTVGPNNLFLRANSSTSTGLDWASPTGAPLATTSKTANYTATTADDIIYCSTTGGAFTVTLYAASGNAGRSLTIVKTSNDFTILTIDGNASETINGSLTTTLATQYEVVRLICDGSSWQIADRQIPSIWTSFTPAMTNITGTQTGLWKREGDSIRVRGKVALTGAVSATLNFATSIPSGLSVSTLTTGLVYGSTTAFNPTSANLAHLYSTNSTTVVAYSQGGTNSWSATIPATWASGHELNYEVLLPITNWAG